MDLYAYRRFDQPPSTGTDLSSYLKEFGFLARMHGSQRKVLLDLFEDAAAMKLSLAEDTLADCLASAIAQLLTSKRAYSSVILKALRFTRDYLLDSGFHETNPHRLLELVPSNTTNLVVIAGCQGRRLLRSRAFAAADLIKILPAPISMFPTGLRPPSAAKPQIPDESARIESLILERWGRRSGRIANSPLGKVTTYNIHLEGESQTTKENITKFLEVSSENRYWTTPPNVFIVSSTWHLPKLAKEFTEAITSRRLQYNVLVLFGAEPLDKLNDTSEDTKYAKQALFRMYQFVIQEEMKSWLAKRRLAGVAQTPKS